MNDNDIKYKAGQIHWQEAGQGSPIIFLHAMVGSSTAWQPQFDFFYQNYRCIAWDMPGFGDSEKLSDSADMDEVVETLHTFIVKTLKLPKANLVGLSVGGMILQVFASKYPHLVTSATIIDSSPKFGLSGAIKPEEFINPIVKQLETGIDIESFSREMVAAVVGPTCSNLVKNAATKSMSRATRSGLALTTRLIGNHDALDTLDQISAPTLVMVGAEDTDTPPAYSQAITNAIPNAELVVINEAGHLSNLENPTQLNQALHTFISNISG